jgi:hypothetical protein
MSARQRAMPSPLGLDVEHVCTRRSRCSWRVLSCGGRIRKGRTRMALRGVGVGVHVGGSTRLHPALRKVA